MGVRPVTPGWASWIAKPAPGNLTAARIAVPTPKGLITVKFTRKQKGEVKPKDSQMSDLSLEVGIPEGTVASLCMPLFGANATQVALRLDGVPQTRTRIENGGAYACVDAVKSMPHLDTSLLEAFLRSPAGGERSETTHLVHI
jgi:hypothetical protein